ncbi:hypothetical protein AB0N97_39845 [Streptomyces collinus]|uniref:hypothetical protein n=1 Tax=Streptomyces collinus TaxID=42684 RepID=UPI003426D676
MSKDSAGAFVFGGVPVHQRLVQAAAQLERTVVEQLAGELEVYRVLPSEELWGDVARMVGRGIRYAESAV